MEIWSLIVALCVGAIPVGAVIAFLLRAWLTKETETDRAKDQTIENEISTIKRDFGHFKHNHLQEADAFKARFDRIDQHLADLTTQYATATSDLPTFMEVTKLENQVKLDALKRLEEGQKNQAADHRQWVEQITKSLREISTRSAD